MSSGPVLALAEQLVHLAHILLWNDGNALIQIWLPQHSDSSALMRAHLSHDMEQIL